MDAPPGLFWSVAAGQARRFALSDALEPVFGPDPGLLRLRVAGRAVCAATAALGVMLPLAGSQLGATGLAFMLAVNSSIAVRDATPQAQAVTLALLPVPALGAVVLSGVLADWPLLGKLAFIAVAVAAVLARQAGPRGMALGMVGFIAYFIAEITRPALATLPLLALGIGVGIAASALMRFVLLPDRLAATLRHIERDLRRRTARILAQAARMLRGGAGQERDVRRTHREIARLNDTFQIAEDQLHALGGTEAAQALERRFFALELAGERVLRIVANGNAVAERDIALPRIQHLARLLQRGDLPPPRQAAQAQGATGTARRHAPLSAALDALEDTLAQFAQDSAQAPHPARLPGVPGRAGP